MHAETATADAELPDAAEQPRHEEPDSSTDAPTESGEPSAASVDDDTVAPTATEPADGDEPQTDQSKGRRGRRRDWDRVFVFGLIPVLAFLLAGGAAFLKWRDMSVRDANTARIESVQAATDSTIKILSYRPDTVESDLGSARDRLTGTFRDSYTALTKDVVIPGAKQKQISAVATVPAAASVSATPDHAIVLVFVNQTILIGNDPPTSTASSVRVALDKVGNRWLISDFTPI